MRDRLAVVITTYSVDRAKDVCDALTSLAHQADPVDEVVFVADGPEEIRRSVDAHAHDLGLRSYQSLHNKGPRGLSAGRNAGMMATTSPLVAFLDDDAIAEAGWSIGLRAGFAQDDETIGLTGPVQPMWIDAGMDWLPRELYWLISCTEFSRWTSRRRVRGAWGVNMAFRRMAFDAAGAFSTSAGYAAGAFHQPWADDLEFSLRARRATGGSVWFEPRMRVWHKVYPYRVSPEFAAARARQVGASLRLARRAYPEFARGLFEMSVGMDVAAMILRSLALFPRQPQVAARQVHAGTAALVNALIGFLRPNSALMAPRSPAGSG